MDVVEAMEGSEGQGGAGVHIKGFTVLRKPSWWMKQAVLLLASTR